MLTGRRLFQGETTTEILASVIKEEPDWNRVPAKARLMLRRCLEKDPTKRLHDIADAVPLLESAPEQAPVARPRLTWIAWGAAAMLLVIAAAQGVLYFRGREAGPQQISRFQIPVPERTLVGGGFNISPDGRRLIFSGRRAGPPQPPVRENLGFD